MGTEIIGGNRMNVATVIGTIRLGPRMASLERQRFLLVDWDGRQIAAADQVVAKAGDRVLLATGPAALRCCMESPLDAAVVAIVEPS